MPYVESLDELVQWIANSLGIYCEHAEPANPDDSHIDHDDGGPCRIGFEIEMRDRIRGAVEREQDKEAAFQARIDRERARSARAAAEGEKSE